MPACTVPDRPVDGASTTCGQRPIDHHIRSAAGFFRPDLGAHDVAMVSTWDTAANGEDVEIVELDAG